jgi:autotransporter-associated beta strand protein
MKHKHDVLLGPLLRGTTKSSPGRSLKAFFLLLWVSLWVSFLPGVQAATVIWTGGQGAARTSWSLKNNWNGAGNTGPVAGDNLVFAGTNKLTNTNDLTAGTSFVGILFDASAGAFVLNGNAITLSGNVTNQSGSLQTINLAITLGSHITFEASSAGMVLGGVVSGTNGLVKNGDYDLLLTAANTYSGGTTVNAGTLTLAGSGTLGATNGALSIVAGTVDLGGLARTNGVLTLDTGTLTNGTLAAAAFFLTNAGTVAASLAGSGTVTKSGSGTTVLSRENTHTGGTILQAGTLALGANGALGVGSVTFASNATILALTNLQITNPVTIAAGAAGTFQVTSARTQTHAGVISGPGSLIKAGGGTLQLTASNTYGGGTVIQAGTLVLDRAGNGTGGTIPGTIAIQGGTLLLGQANQIGDDSAVILSGGSIHTSGFADRAGPLSVDADSAITGLVTSPGGGVATGNDFIFSSVNLSNYATGGGGGHLDLGAGYGSGAMINFASSNFTDWTGYSTVSLNNFSDKIIFGDTGLKAQINFNAATGMTFITAVPEPGACVAAVLLVVLIGAAECRRRQKYATRNAQDLTHAVSPPSWDGDPDLNSGARSNEMNVRWGGTDDFYALQKR